ncbi:MAG: leucine-rich repeat protein [Agathobacter sp.]
MKNIVYGVGLSILTAILLMIITTTSGRMMRESEIRETLSNAVDNAVENAMETNTYQVNDRKQFVSDVMQNLALQYHSDSEKIKIAVNNADCEKGSLFITATAYYKNPIGNTGSVSYTKKSIYSTKDTREDKEYVIRYMLDTDVVYREYMTRKGDEYPIPNDPEVEGKVFVHWVDRDGNVFVKGSSFPVSVRESHTYMAEFTDTAVLAQILTLSGDDTMVAGARQSLTTEIFPANATNKALRWTSSNPSVLSVNSVGFVTAHKPGEADVSVELTDGSLAPATIHITVTEVSEIEVEADASFDNLDSQNRILVSSKDGQQINADCTYYSYDSNVMYVNPVGVMQPVAAGTTHIHVRHKESGASVTFPVMVVETKDYHGVYDGNPHSATVNCPGAEITYETEEYGQSTEVPEFTDAGTYKVNYRVIYSTCEPIEGSMDVIIEKAERNISVSASEDTIYYPEKKTYTFTTDEEDLDNIAVNVENNDGCLTYEVKNNEIIVTPGVKEGDVNLNITVPETDNYKMTEKTILLHVKNGFMDIEVTVPYGGAYDGENHTIKVTPKAPCEDAAVEYSLSEDGEYSETAPECIDAGTYKIYYRVTKSGYKMRSGSAEVTINRTHGKLAFNRRELALTAGQSDVISISENLSGGEVSLSALDESLVSLSRVYETLKTEEVKDEETGEVITPATETKYLVGYRITAKNGARGFTMLKAESPAGGNYEKTECMIPVYIGEEAGVYDASGKMVLSWNDLATAGVDTAKDYTKDSYKTDESSVYSVLKGLKEGTKVLYEDSNFADADFHKIVVPSTRTRIGSYAFAGLSDTTEIVVLSGLSEIGDHAFTDCEKLQHVQVPGTVTTIGNDAFADVEILCSDDTLSGAPWGAKQIHDFSSSERCFFCGEAKKNEK